MTWPGYPDGCWPGTRSPSFALVRPWAELRLDDLDPLYPAASLLLVQPASQVE